jgi:hypothetical protein
MAIHLEAIGRQTLQQVAAVDVVVGARKVSDEQPCRMTTVMQEISKAQVIQHILRNVPPLNERRLEKADHVVQR